MGVNPPDELSLINGINGISASGTFVYDSTPAAPSVTLQSQLRAHGAHGGFISESAWKAETLAMDHLLLDFRGAAAAIAGGRPRSETHPQGDHRPVLRDALRWNAGQDETGTM